MCFVHFVVDSSLLRTIELFISFEPQYQLEYLIQAKKNHNLILNMRE